MASLKKKFFFFFSFFHDRKLWRKLLGTSRYRSTTFSFSIVLYCRWRPFLHLLPLSSESCCARKKELNADEGWDRIKRNDSFKYLHLLTRTRERQRKKMQLEFHERCEANERDKLTQQQQLRYRRERRGPGDFWMNEIRCENETFSGVCSVTKCVSLFLRVIWIRGQTRNGCDVRAK